MIYCIRQNGFDFGCLLLKSYLRAGFFWLFCHRSRFVATESNRICFDVPSGLFELFQHCRVGFGNKFIQKGLPEYFDGQTEDERSDWL